MRFVVASHNPKKLAELQRMLAPLGIDAFIDPTLEDVEETGTTFEENALLKAESACRQIGCPAIADDSGLMIDALDGRPGVYSARYAGENATDADRIAKVLREMRDVPADQRGAHFVSCVCCVFPNGDVLTVRGECHGRIAAAPSGNGGFGYDPIFVVDGDKTFAELSPDEKDAISHRGNSLRLMKEALTDYLSKQ